MPWSSPASRHSARGTSRTCSRRGRAASSSCRRVLALAVAVAAARGRRVFALAALLWLIATAALVSRRVALARAPARARSATRSTSCTRAVGRFATVVLPFDPVAEPGLHALLLAGFSIWLLALALVWLVAARPLPTVVLGVLPLALVSSEFPLGQYRAARRAAGGARGVDARRGPTVGPATDRRVRGAARRDRPRRCRAAGARPRIVPRLARLGQRQRRLERGSDRRPVRLGSVVRRVALHGRARRRPACPLAPACVLACDGARLVRRTAFRGARAGDRDRSAPAPKRTSSRGRRAAATTVQIETAALDVPYLVGAGNPVSFQVPDSTGGGTLDANGVLRVLRAPSHGTTYRVSAVLADPSRAELRHPRAGIDVTGGDELDATPFADRPPLPAFGDPQHDAAVAAALAGEPGLARGLRVGAAGHRRGDDALRRRARARAEAPDEPSVRRLVDPLAARSRCARTLDHVGVARVLPDVLGLDDRAAAPARGARPGRRGVRHGQVRPGLEELRRRRPRRARVGRGVDPGSRLRALRPDAGPLAAHEGVLLVRPRTRRVGHALEAPPPSAIRRTSTPAGEAGASTGSITHRASGIAAGRSPLARGRARRRVARAGRARCSCSAPRAWRAGGRGPRDEVGSSRARLASRARRRGLELPLGDHERRARGRARVAGSRSTRAHGRAPPTVRPTHLPSRRSGRSRRLRSETRRLRKAIRSSRRVTLPV